MAYFLNNDFKNNEFELASRDKFFVDKTSLIEKINSLIGIKDRFVCITRPRRFGKTLNAMMLASYYSKNADFTFSLCNRQPYTLIIYIGAADGVN